MDMSVANWTCYKNAFIDGEKLRMMRSMCAPKRVPSTPIQSIFDLQLSDLRWATVWIVEWSTWRTNRSGKSKRWHESDLPQHGQHHGVCQGKQCVGDAQDAVVMGGEQQLRETQRHGNQSGPEYDCSDRDVFQPCPAENLNYYMYIGTYVQIYNQVLYILKI